MVGYLPSSPVLGHWQLFSMLCDVDNNNNNNLNAWANLKIRLIIKFQGVFQSDLCKKTTVFLKNNNCFLKKIGCQLFLNRL